MELLESLIEIQSRLNAPKSKYNKFGKFNYRSLEDILTSIKPLLKELSCGLYFHDEVVEHGDNKLFLKTTLTFFNKEGKTISITAEAGHASDKSGMDFAQITGAASSYARKYAMNALFCIDDSPEIDSDEYTEKKQKKQPATPIPQQAPIVPQAAPTDNELEYLRVCEELEKVTTLDGLKTLFFEKAEKFHDKHLNDMFTRKKQELQKQ